MVVLDSTFLIDFLKNRPLAILKSRDFDNDISTTRLNVFEILVGIYRRPPNTQKRDLDSFYDFLNSINILELDRKSANEAAKISSELIRSGKMVPEIDILIAAISLSNGQNRIITQNTKDFSKIPGLKVENY